MRRELSLRCAENFLLSFLGSTILRRGQRITLFYAVGIYGKLSEQFRLVLEKKYTFRFGHSL
jgi:hypothetical protein